MKVDVVDLVEFMSHHYYPYATSVFIAWCSQDHYIICRGLLRIIASIGDDWSSRILN